MSWVKLDDQFPYHRKAIAAGLEGRALYVTALCYSAHQLTDGFIPDSVLTVLGALSGVPDVKQTASKLLDICLWHACEGGYQIHDYHDYNPTKDDVLTTREARREAGSIGGSRSSEAKRQAKSKQTVKQTPKQNSSEGQPRTPTPSPLLEPKGSATCPKEWMTALYSLTETDPSLASAGMRKRISETGKALIRNGAQLADVDRFAEWWLSDKWRKENTPTPTPEKIRDNWSKMNGNGHKPDIDPEREAALARSFR